MKTPTMTDEEARARLGDHDLVVKVSIRRLPVYGERWDQHHEYSLERVLNPTLLRLYILGPPSAFQNQLALIGHELWEQFLAADPAS